MFFSAKFFALVSFAPRNVISRYLFWQRGYNLFLKILQIHSWSNFFRSIYPPTNDCLTTLLDRDAYLNVGCTRNFQIKFFKNKYWRFSCKNFECPPPIIGPQCPRSSNLALKRVYQLTFVFTKMVCLLPIHSTEERSTQLWRASYTTHISYCNFEFIKVKLVIIPFVRR